MIMAVFDYLSYVIKLKTRDIKYICQVVELMKYYLIMVSIILNITVIVQLEVISLPSYQKSFPGRISSIIRKEPIS